MIKDGFYKIEGYRVQVRSVDADYILTIERFPGFRAAIPKGLPDKEFFLKAKMEIAEHAGDTLRKRFPNRNRNRIIFLDAYRKRLTTS